MLVEPKVLLLDLLFLTYICLNISQSNHVIVKNFLYASGLDIIVSNKVTVAKGGTCNNATYIDPNTNIIDQTNAVMGVIFGTDFTQSTRNRTLVTTIPQQLLHFKIESTPKTK